MAHDSDPIRLRDGTTTEDPRLDRLVQFDERSREFPIRAALAPTEIKPRGYSWRVDRWFDQGREGQCVEYAWTHDLAARPLVIDLPPEDDPEWKQEMTRRYWTMQRDDPWPGGEYEGAQPRYSGTSVLAGARLHQALGYFREYRWAFGIEDLILAVGYKGPAVLGVNWYDGMFDTNANGYITATGAVRGGHAILCYSVSWRDEHFTLWNSWGADWGVRGRAKISFTDMERLLDERGEACIPVGRKKA